jgi:hypothetical protein
VRGVAELEQGRESYAKLRVSSRTAASAFAFEHDLV